MAVGRQRIAVQRASGALPLVTLIEKSRPDHPARVPGTAIYMTARIDNVPAALLHNMKHNKILHERNVLMTVRTEDVPRLPEAERLQIDHLSQNFHTVTIHYGFLEEPDIPRALALCRVGGFRFNLMDTSFFVGREKIVANGRSGIMLPFKKLFVLLTNVALDATEFSTSRSTASSSSAARSNSSARASIWRGCSGRSAPFFAREYRRFHYRQHKPRVPSVSARPRAGAAAARSSLPDPGAFSPFSDREAQFGIGEDKIDGLVLRAGGGAVFRAELAVELDYIRDGVADHRGVFGEAGHPFSPGLAAFADNAA